MRANRIRSYESRFATSASKAPSTAAPQSAATIPAGFMICPPQLFAPNAWQQEIYRLAYQRTQAQMQTPRHYRLFSVWN